MLLIRKSILEILRDFNFICKITDLCVVMDWYTEKFDFGSSATNKILSQFHTLVCFTKATANQRAIPVSRNTFLLPVMTVY